MSQVKMRGGQRPRYDRMDDGFTLVELIVVVAVLPLIVGAISVALLSVFQSQNQISNSLTSSNDAQVTSSTYAQDIQSAVWISQTALDACGGAPTGASLIVSISPDGVSSGSIANVVTYIKVPTSGSSTFTVWRDACTAGIGSTATSAHVIARNALYDCSNTLKVLPSSVQSQLLGTGNPCTPASLPNGGWVAAPGTQSVSLTLNEPFIKGSSTNSLNYVLSAAPRASGTGGAAPGGKSPILPLTLVGNCPSAVNPNGHPFVVEGGTGAVGSTSSESTCGSGAVSKLQSATPYDFSVTDPFAGLSPPTSTTPADQGSCTNKLCTAGYYPNNFFPGNSVPDGYTFDPSQSPPGHPTDKGTIEFQSPITLSSCNTGVSFASGSTLTPATSTTFTYVFDNGLTVSSCKSATLGSAIYIFQTTSNSGNLFSSDKSTINYSGGTVGLLLYMSPTNNGTVSISNSFSSSGLYDPPSGPYEGIVLWDASSGPLSFGQGTGGGSGPQWNGGIYAPVANPVQIGGGYNGFTVTFMVINNYTSNGSQTNISSG